MIINQKIRQKICQSNNLTNLQKLNIYSESQLLSLVIQKLKINPKIQLLSYNLTFIQRFQIYPKS